MNDEATATSVRPAQASRPDGVRAARVTFGSAHLFVDGMPAALARELLDCAVQAGVARLDTSPSYGYGQSEALVAQVAARWADLRVSTKVGLAPSVRPPRWRSAAGRLLDRLPAGSREALKSALGRRRPEPADNAPSGRFDIDTVRLSIERSLVRLGPLDRLLLHEVHPADVTDDLLELLLGYRRRGDLATLGVATANAATLAALARSHGLFTVAHVNVDPLGWPIPGLAELADIRLVGHGALGPAGRTLAHVRARIATRPALARHWAAAVAGTRYDGPAGMADALLARASQTFAGELIVATRRPGRIPGTVSAASGLHVLPAPIAAVLSDALASTPPTGNRRP